MKAMLLAAGLGTRMQPLSLTKPKALIAVGGLTLLERNILYLKSFGIKEVVVNVHHFAEQIIAFLGERQESLGVVVQISDESDAVLETGGGLLRARPFLEDAGTFVLMNVDILTDLDLGKMIAAHRFKTDALATLAVSQRVSSRRLLFDTDNRLRAWQHIQTGETKGHFSPALTAFAFSGIHVLSTEIFKHLRQKGKFSIIDAYMDLAEAHAIYAHLQADVSVLDVGKPEAIPVAERWLGL